METSGTSLNPIVLVMFIFRDDMIMRSCVKLLMLWKASRSMEMYSIDGMKIKE